MLTDMLESRFDPARTMRADASIAGLAALLADPSRAAMLGALMDGRALTATELALAGDVAASTASSHLARLTAAGMLTLVRQGRHRYFRIADPHVAETFERLQCLSATRRDTPIPTCGPADDALRQARCCYDHLAGAYGVTLLEHLCDARLLHAGDGSLALTTTGETWCAGIGIDLPALRNARRPLCRPCLDWSERRMHLAGALGAALLRRLLALDHVRRRPQGRALDVTPAGRRFVERLRNK